MNLPVDLEVKDFELAHRTKDLVQVGHYFAFVRDAKAFADTPSGRSSRLLIEQESSPRVIPLVDEPLELAGMTLAPRPRAFDPLATVVTDRDLYRAERDTVYLFCAVASSVERPRLVIEVNSTSLTERELSVDKGVAIETPSCAKTRAFLK